METKDVLRVIAEFAEETHGRTDYGKDNLFIMGESSNEFVPYKFLVKKLPNIKGPETLLNLGLLYSSYDHAEQSTFKKWYEKQFQKKITQKQANDVSIIYLPNHLSIFTALESVHKNYEILRESKILINGKNLPVQLGEWYAKGIFGLKQVKSTSQRGFDLVLGAKKIEVKVHWSDYVSPKGIKLKRSAIQLSDHIILIYLSSSFMIKDICFLDSDFIIRKFVEKGHNVFLKDADIAPYFFSKSDKHFNKVVNKTALMKFSSPTLAVKLSGRI